MDNAGSSPVIRANDASDDSASLVSANLIGVERSDQAIKESVNVIDLERDRERERERARDENANNKSHRSDIGKHRGINLVNLVNHVNHIPVAHLMTEQIEDQQQSLTNTTTNTNANPNTNTDTDTDNDTNTNTNTSSLILLQSSSANNSSGEGPNRTEVDSMANNSNSTSIYATPTMLPSFSHYSAGKLLSLHLLVTL